MHDSFLLWTPIFILAVLALLGFAGCGRVGFDPLHPPKNLNVIARCGWNEVHWSAVANSPNYDLMRMANGGEQLIFHGPATTFNDIWILDGPSWAPPSYKVRTIFSPNYHSDYSAPVSAAGLGMPQALLTNAAMAIIPRSNFTGYVGMEIQVSKTLWVCAIGRYQMPGNGSNPNHAYVSHYMRIIDAVRDTEVAWAELVTTTGGNTGNHLQDPNTGFVYAAILQPVLIGPDSVNTEGRFYVVSHETDTTGDPNPESWNDLVFPGSLQVIPTPDAAVIGAVMGDIGAWVRQPNGSFCYGPVNILYQVNTLF